nr:beta-1,4-N-acetylgalactosaminyltransferase bre-4-like [Helicoverpa armigera]XP_049699592.1 beta-1,4-N-acetylgalactosaminyltransferase bre-4-like [Helicoverpa armigera]XP_049699593.1 beta-1,4-N-acetylgalactosaminyltransferase bre-4-like [Helicoverpa armigera]XP_049699594.1 beta-1,4-N-acetylgalactosaminyltransferase bre-4-like [Helicoverpa armigera]
MPKCSLKTRILQLRVITCMFAILFLKAFIHFFVTYGIYNYPHLPADVLETQLYKRTAPSLVLHKSKPDCKYDEILKSTSSVQNWEVPKKFDDFSAKGLVNGTYVPEHCNPLFSVAIIVAYRNRQSQLDVFLPYMHNFLRRQNIHYRLYLVEQQDEKTFNKGVLLNVGARAALRDRFPCLVLQDVDLLPLDAGNLYACAAEPRHLSASIDKFRFVLPYDYLVGGVLAIKADHFLAVNGFSNRFEGWGGEDDDFSWRLTNHKLDIVRFPRQLSRYTMLRHRQEARNSQRRRIMRENRQRGAADGLSSLPRVAVSLAANRLFTLVAVRL